MYGVFNMVIVVHLMILYQVNNLFSTKWWIVNDVQRHNYHPLFSTLVYCHCEWHSC